MRVQIHMYILLDALFARGLSINIRVINTWFMSYFLLVSFISFIFVLNKVY